MNNKVMKKKIMNVITAVLVIWGVIFLLFGVVIGL